MAAMAHAPYFMRLPYCGYNATYLSIGYNYWYDRQTAFPNVKKMAFICMYRSNCFLYFFKLRLIFPRNIKTLVS